jgi:hypothetical protein
MVPIPANVICASAIVCERLLLEQDKTPSAIRISDVFFAPEVPESVSQIIEVGILAIVKGCVTARNTEFI